jgi:peroxiredoxin
LPVEGNEGRPVPLVITSGEAEENQRLVEEYGLRCTVLLQEDREVATAYQANGTPVGYLIDEQGVLASEIAVGAQNLLALANPSDAVSGEEGEKGPDLFLGRPRRSLSESRINRDGLKAGTPAPDFRLPRLDGGELSLSEYRGQWVLLVFSDPECEPCNQLLPELERLHRSSSKLAILMVSRLSVAANRAKVAAHGLTFPVALQRSWEISRLYGKFATPIGYLIDPEGIIAADLAEGREEVLALASRARGGGDGKEVRPWQRWSVRSGGSPPGNLPRRARGHRARQQEGREKT